MHEYSGIYCPIVTPFKKDGSVDEDGLRSVINFVLDKQKVTGLVPCGTTGESPALTEEEHVGVIRSTVKAAGGKVPIIAGSGTNCTGDTVRLTKWADEAGADAFLVVGPYYNKPSMEGMAAHYGAVAKCTKKDVIIYNIPGRTSKNIEPKTILEIAKNNHNVVGLKDAAGSIDQTMEILAGSRKLGKKFYVLAGDDQMTYPTLALGGHGAISAVSHVVGAEMVEMVGHAKAGRWDEAREIHFSILPAIKLLFLETNPAPVKAAMEMMGVIENDPLRLPLVPMTAAGREKLKAELKNLGKI